METFKAGLLLHAFEPHSAWTMKLFYLHLTVKKKKRELQAFI